MYKKINFLYTSVVTYSNNLHFLCISMSYLSVPRPSSFASRPRPRLRNRPWSSQDRDTSKPNNDPGGYILINHNILWFVETSQNRTSFCHHKVKNLLRFSMGGDENDQKSNQHKGTNAALLRKQARRSVAGYLHRPVLGRTREQFPGSKAKTGKHDVAERLP